MAMTQLLEKAFQEAAQRSEEEQKAVAEMVIVYLQDSSAEEAEWEALVQSPESQKFLDRMAEKVRKKRAKGELLDFDPGDK